MAFLTQTIRGSNPADAAEVVMRTLSLFLLVAGCSETGSVLVDNPSPYIYDAEDQPHANLDISELAVTIQAALDLIGDLSAEPILAAYDEVMQFQDGYCPAYYATDDGTYWYDNCSVEGSSYAGYAFTEDYDQIDDGYGNLITGRSLFGGATITTPTGDRFNASGGAGVFFTEVPADGLTAVTQVINGTFEWTGASGNGTWLQTDVRPDLEMASYLTEPNELLGAGKGLYITGAITNVTQTGSVVSFTDYWQTNEGLGATCEAEPHGTVSVRAEDGSWYDVVFDGDWDGSPVDPDACDSCGRAFFRGDRIGEVCVDFSEGLNWEVSPW